MKVIEPLNDLVIVKVASQEERRNSGIIIPDVIKEKPWEVLVLAVGPGKYDANGKIIPMTVKVGETVLCGKYAGSEIDINNEKHLILHEDEVLAKVKEVD